jgi:hypothetical protein
MSEFIIVSNDLAPSIVEVSSPGPQGSSGTVSVGTVTTGASGSAAEVTNSGTPSAAVLNFTIPKGDIGDVTPAATAAKNAAEAAATASAASSTAAQSSATSATASATAAQSSATAASTSAATATTKSQEASTSASNAAASAQSVLTAANTATTKAQESAASAAASLSSANTATTKAQEASASATTADTKAQEAVVSANVATNKAQEASASAVTALSAQQISTENATLAIAQANLATTKAAEASTSATNALSQASTATAQAQEATAQTAVSTAQAVISTTQAGISAAQATISTTQAGISAAQANTSTAQATIATTQATNANTSAVQAASSATAALASQVAAAGSATSANTSAGSASGSAASALAIYGTTAAQQTALANAQSAASLAQGYALSASSAIQQDLSGVTAQALHRSPNAVTAMFVYDTSKDSDGGAWTEKCQHTSWYNEALNGKWLGAWSNETMARHSNATVGSNLVVNGNFASGVFGWTDSYGVTSDASSGVLKLTSTLNYGYVRQQIATVIGKQYRLTFGVKTGLFSLGSSTFSTSSYASNSSESGIVFTATTTTTILTIGALTSGVGVVTYWDDIRVEEVTALTTASGDYYQSTTDGKFYRLWKNLNSGSTLVPTSSSSITYVGNAGVGPDGISNATSVETIATVGNSSSGWHTLLTAIPIGGTISYFVKSLSGDGRVIGQLGSGDGYEFDAINGVMITSDSRHTYTVSSAPNGYWRLAINRGTAGGANLYAVPKTVGNKILVSNFQTEYGPVSAFEAKVATGSVSETFRGNKADFPRLAGIVAEATSVTIYDLTEAGRPMWMRFRADTNTVPNSSIFGRGLYYTMSDVEALSGKLLIGNLQNSAERLLAIDFSKDSAFLYTSSGSLYGTYTGLFTRSLAQRNISGSGMFVNNGYVPELPNGAVNAVAMTILPDAPVDAVTGLQTPTIAVATGGGVSVIKHNGTVVNSSNTTSRARITLSPTILTTIATGDTAWVYALNPGSLGASFALTAFPTQARVGEYANANAQSSRGEFGKGGNTARIAKIKNHESDPARSVVTQITNTFNTGHLVGDIRRAYLADTDVGNVSGGELVVNGTFATDVSSWSNKAGTSGTITWNSNGTATISGGIIVQTVSVTTGKIYRMSVDASAVTGTLFAVLNSLGDGNGSNLGTISISSPSTGNVLTFVATGNTHSISFSSTNTATIDNVSFQEVVVDRSYKAKFAPITGTLTKTQVAAAAQMVAYSGFSAANYLREPYSADLDFGTGEWSASAWVNVPVTMPVGNFPVTGNELTNNANWVAFSGSGVSVSGTTVTVSDTTGTSGYQRAYQDITTVAGKWYLFSGLPVSTTDSRNVLGLNIWNGNFGTIIFSRGGLAPGSLFSGAFLATGTTTRIDLVEVDGPNTTSKNWVWDNVTVKELSPALVADRAHSSGPKVNLGVDIGGRLTATAFDGTTTRTVTTTAAYNTGTWLKAEADYTTDGTLSISVNGVEVAATRGNPLLSLNSRYNLANFSEQFNSWSKSQVTVTENTATDPLGGNTASKVAENSTSSTAFNVFQTISGADAGVSYQFVLYAKAAERSQVHMQFDNSGAFAGNDRFARFDLSLGTVLTSSNATGVITNEGNGWYKCTISATTSAAGNIAAKVLLSNANTFVYTGVIGNGILLWGADVRRTALAALPYQRTTTVAETIIAPLTIGNSFAANAPFPGSIALLKLSATVPTAEQSVWMYEQEKQMFRESAQVTLPDANAIVDLAYDDATDKWLAVSATNESEFSGLIRTSVTASPAGSYSKISAASGIQLQARTTTNPGVDVTIPPYGLREELVNRSQAAARLARNLVSFDYVGGFTANTTTGSTAITSAANITYPVTYIGARVSATGIPADTFVVAISGTTIYLTKAATSTASAVQISFNDFILPVGYEARDVLLAGVSQREGTTQAFTRLFDGFKETIRFTTAPSNTALVQIKATRSIQ